MFTFPPIDSAAKTLAESYAQGPPQKGLVRHQPISPNSHCLA